LTLLSRIVWSEGMYLGPHHFQAEGTYFENSIHFANRALWYSPFGLAGLELSGEALRNGTVAVVHARGVMPDGLVFHMPEADAAPPARHIVEDFPPTLDRIVVLLAVPKKVASGANCALEDGSAQQRTVRFTAEERPMFDENTGRDEKAVRIARKNLRLILETEVTENDVTLPIARVIRDASGQYIYDETFIPPCLQISASDRLMRLSRRIIDILSEKNRALSAGNRGLGDLSSGLSARQVAQFWFLHAVNSSLASLRHICFTKHGHPEELYRAMASLAGALCTFGLESHPAELPLYDHLHPEPVFDALDRHIRDHLEMLSPTNCVKIPLAPTGKYMYEGTVTDDRCFGRSRWLFAIHSSMGEASLIAATPQLVKVCSARFIGELVRRALPGLPLTHLPVPPAAASPRVECQYFGISKEGPCWDDAVKSKRIGLYVPGDIPNPELELLVILDK
jgi:type VI secretion system protein ImpJ